jgi:hypothetical protein
MTLITGERMLRSAYMKTQPRENRTVTATGPGRLPLTGSSRRRAAGGVAPDPAGMTPAVAGFSAVETFKGCSWRLLADWFIGRTKYQARASEGAKTLEFPGVRSI